jgi:hypothetical protein
VRYLYVIVTIVSLLILIYIFGKFYVLFEYLFLLLRTFVTCRGLHFGGEFSTIGQIMQNEFIFSLARWVSSDRIVSAQPDFNVRTRRPLGVNLGSVDRASSGKYARIV